MKNIVDNTQRIEICKNKMTTLKNELEKNKVEIEKHYKNSYMNHRYVVDNYQSVNFQLEDFNHVFLEAINYCQNQELFFEELMNLDIYEVSKYSIQMEMVLLECLHNFDMIFPDNQKFNNDEIYHFNNRPNFSVDYYSIIILSKFSNINENIVLIGGNGSGKSSLANVLKGNDKTSISVVPAQKSLYFSISNYELLLTKTSDLELTLLENNISKSKSKEDSNYFYFQNNQFTKLIIGMRQEYYGYLYECNKEKISVDETKSVFGNLNQLFKIIFPDIILELDPSREHLKCTKNGKTYHVNSLSEGEKAVIYYVISVLMARENSFIVVDEPETYLNPSLATILWDMLIKIRKDCQFIFITHSVDFVLSRNDAKIMWIKDFKYPNKWRFDEVENNFVLPKKLLTEVLGSKKPIIFCEGDDKSSLDYKIYQALLGSNYTVIPVGGHLDVIKNCDVVTNSEWLSINCIGIIDGDNYDNNKIEKLKRKNVIVLPFNEIEMLLLSDEILQSLMGTIFGVDSANRISEFKSNFWIEVNKKKKKIALANTKSIADQFIQSKRIENFKNLDELENNIQEISQFNIREHYQEKLNIIEETIVNNNYSELLKICNLKHEISRGLANKYLDNNFEEKALNHIQIKSELREKLIKEYFNLLQ